MSKKRNIALNRKWKLSRQLADYKQHKKNKRSLGYQDEQLVSKRGKAKKKHPCTRLKGEHNFVFVRATKYNWWKKVGKLYVCSACGKKDLIFKDDL